MLWAHEYGHNAGLDHNIADVKYLLYPVLTGEQVGLTTLECDAFHSRIRGRSLS